MLCAAGRARAVACWLACMQWAALLMWKMPMCAMMMHMMSHTIIFANTGSGEAPVWVSASLPKVQRRQGFVGVYHTAHGAVEDGHDSDAFDVGSWGIVGQSNAPVDGSTSFEAAIRLHCRTKDINALYGLLTPPSEGGMFNNTNDSDAIPVPHRPTGPLGAPGLLQGAARWSTLARTACPQIAGVVIDDFWSNYPAHQRSASETARCPACCASGRCRESICPNDRQYMYGHNTTGVYCCKWPAPVKGHCAPADGIPQPAHPPCCLCPGSQMGCQGIDPCRVPRSAQNATCDLSGRQLHYSQIRDIKAALMGHAVSNNGIVNYSSPARTPWLKLFVVTYDHEIERLANQTLLEDNIVDAVSFWISGPNQRTQSLRLADYVMRIRQLIGANRPLFTGGYVTYSSIGWTDPSSFYNVLDASIDMYDRGDIGGFFVFAGSVLAGMNSSLWHKWDLPGHLDAHVQPWLGSAVVTVVDSTTHSRIPGAMVEVALRNAHVTRKATSLVAGQVQFGGWAGKRSTTPHKLMIQAQGYSNLTTTVQLLPQTTLNITVQMTVDKENQ